ncbi:MAG: hypothetical protein U0694_08760 [Anaerolineae bacterium]
MKSDQTLALSFGILTRKVGVADVALLFEFSLNILAMNVVHQ